MHTPQHDAYLALGANLGQPQQMLHWAVAAIAQLPTTRLLAVSSLYRTAPVDSSGPDYINAVVHVQTALEPLALLHAVQHIEQQAGRTRPYHNAPRTLDIDVLLFDQVQQHTPELTLPHPRMWQRAFVLVPLAEIAPHLVSAAQLQAVAYQAIERLPDAAQGTSQP